MPRFSVQICCYNSERYLAQTIESVTRQTLPDWELVIVNDGSTDGTEAIVKRYEKKSLPVVYFYQKNKGFGAARNKAVELSKGDWIAILDHDDLWFPDKLLWQSRSIERHPEAKLFFSNSEWFRDDGKVAKKTIEEGKLPAGILKEPFTRLLGDGCFIDSETVVAEKKALRELGGFNERYRYIVDYDMFLRLAKRYPIYYEDRVMAGWRMHPSQATQKLEEDMAKEYAELLERELKDSKLPFEVRQKVKRSIIYHLNNYSLIRLRKEGPKAFLWTLFSGVKKRPLSPRTYLKTLHTFYRAYRGEGGH